MTRFETHTAATAPSAAKPVLESARSAYGFVPNLLGTMAQAPALLEGYVTLAAIFDKSDLDATERQIVLMTNNRLNDCAYCMAAHTVIARASGVPEPVIEALRSNRTLPGEKLEALRTFAGIVNRTRGWPAQADLEAFLAAGYSRQAVLEVILGTALKVMSNYTNHVAATPLDAAFSSAAWSPHHTEPA
ncbi:carboxymuconolactone decarboxylase family protein [Novosphingobium sp. YJ-S2-02]|uniref:Carboxymuconolactone decarboxylase family protein n=1 Tax=Novosphingobium aureum TaxID=2792964 RepID=A0A931HAU4_9SPHN|nr:carboxymuconolactone decarboxylase family protein [Novosphingobium aureum]MBH0112595.1 carboxymuconolactone decarboxylase family protein [Novosphingobium aureum]